MAKFNYPTIGVIKTPKHDIKQLDPFKKNNPVFYSPGQVELLKPSGLRTEPLIAKNYFGYRMTWSKSSGFEKYESGLDGSVRTVLPDYRDIANFKRDLKLVSSGSSEISADVRDQLDKNPELRLAAFEEMLVLKEAFIPKNSI